MKDRRSYEHGVGRGQAGRAGGEGERNEDPTKYLNEKCAEGQYLISLAFAMRAECTILCNAGRHSRLT